LSHPGPEAVALPVSIADAIVAQARAELPNESCGLILGSGPAASGGVPLRYVPCRNEAASPVRYSVHPDDLYRVTVAGDDAGEVIWGIVHSHVRTPAAPSTTDIERALYPDALHVLISLAGVSASPEGESASLRAWRIVDGAAHEVTLQVLLA
jgi:proteasome lid subunit RPN8/RPN11